MGIAESDEIIWWTYICAAFDSKTMESGRNRLRDAAPRRRFHPDVAAVIEVAGAERAEADAARASQLEAGAIDGPRTPAQIRDRLTKLGLHNSAHSVLLDELDEERKSKPAPVRHPTPHERRYAQAVAEEVVGRIILDANKRRVPDNVSASTPRSSRSISRSAASQRAEGWHGSRQLFQAGAERPVWIICGRLAASDRTWR